MTCQVHHVLVRSVLLLGLVHLWTDQRIPGPTFCRCLEPGWFVGDLTPLARDKISDSELNVTFWNKLVYDCNAMENLLHSSQKVGSQKQYCMARNIFCQSTHVIIHFISDRYILIYIEIYLDNYNTANLLSLSTTKWGDNALGSVRPSVHLSVCMSELSCLNRLSVCL